MMRCFFSSWKQDEANQIIGSSPTFGALFFCFPHPRKRHTRARVWFFKILCWRRRGVRVRERSKRSLIQLNGHSSSFLQPHTTVMRHYGDDYFRENETKEERGVGLRTEILQKSLSKVYINLVLSFLFEWLFVGFFRLKIIFLYYFRIRTEIKFYFRFGIFLYFLCALKFDFLMIIW